MRGAGLYPLLHCTVQLCLDCSPVRRICSAALPYLEIHLVLLGKTTAFLGSVLMAAE